MLVVDYKLLVVVAVAVAVGQDIAEEVLLQETLKVVVARRPSALVARLST